MVILQTLLPQPTTPSPTRFLFLKILTFQLFQCMFYATQILLYNKLSSGEICVVNFKPPAKGASLGSYSTEAKQIKQMEEFTRQTTSGKSQAPR